MKHILKNRLFKLNVYLSYFKVKILIYHTLFRFPFFKKKYLNNEINVEWTKRIETTLSSPDLTRFNKVNQAGQIKNGSIIMHNGLKIFPLSYYNANYIGLLKKTGGLHEPQEEFIFNEILKIVPDNSIMLELGSYWAFYSLWFNLKIKSGQNYMIEPEKVQLLYGKYNFKINHKKGHFYNFFIDEYSHTSNGKNHISVDDFIEKFQINKLSILHSDIQGYEYSMLKGAKCLFEKKDVDFVFISTHSNEIHQKCLDILSITYGYVIIADINLDQSYSVDGLIVAHAPAIHIAPKILESIKSVHSL